MQVTVTIDQTRDEAEDVIDDPEELRRFLEAQLADAAGRGKQPQITFGGRGLAVAFDAVPGSVHVTP